MNPSRLEGVWINLQVGDGGAEGGGSSQPLRPAWRALGKAAAVLQTHRGAFLTIPKNTHFRIIKIYEDLSHNLPIVAAVSHVISDTSAIMNVSHLAEVPESL